MLLNPEKLKGPPPTEAQRHQLAIIRHSMLASPVHTLVYQWLSPILMRRDFPKTPQEGHSDFAKITEMAAQLVQTDPQMRGTLEVVANWVSQPIRAEYLVVFNATARPQASPIGTYI